MLGLVEHWLWARASRSDGARPADRAQVADLHAVRPAPPLVHRWLTFMRYGLPAALMMCLEWWAYEVRGQERCAPLGGPRFEPHCTQSWFPVSCPPRGWDPANYRGGGQM